MFLRLLTAPWRGLQWLGGLLLPVFAKARAPGKLSPRVRWALHFLLVALILVGLGYVNHALDLERVLRTPWQFLRKIWLPLLLLLIYLSLWLGWWLWQLLAQEKETGAYPDIADAWSRAVKALEQAGIILDQVPLFLVLGRPAGPETALFGAARVELIVPQTPVGEAPLHVYASREAVYVTCPEASLLSYHAQFLESPPEPETEEAPPPEQSPSPPVVSPLEGLTAEGLALPPAAPGDKAPRQAPASLVLDDEAASALMPPSTAADSMRRPTAPPARRGRRPFVLKDTAVAEDQTARLEYVCQLIVSVRRPYCPLNGILLLLPFSALESDSSANQTGAVCEQDLTTVERTVQLHCPVLTMVCDVETAPGFADFRAAFPPEYRTRRLGKAFPFLADADLATMPKMLNAGTEWICQELLPALVYRLLRLTPTTKEELAASIRTNGRLFLFLDALFQRQERLGRLLIRASTQAHSRFWLSGCYLIATGADAVAEQAFVADAFRLLVDNQNFVAWTPEALAEETGYRRLARFGFFGLIVLAAGILILSVVL